MVILKVVMSMFLMIILITKSIGVLKNEEGSVIDGIGLTIFIKNKKD
ncbi:hypothetical protein ABGF26_02760 [Helcococcus ovis]